jgi:chitinase
MRLFRFTLAALFSVLLLNSCKKETTPNPTPPPTPPPTPAPGCATNIAPANQSFVMTGSTVTLSWNAAPNATAYDLYVGITPGAATLVAGNLTTTSTTYTVGTTANANYFWYVVPKNSAGQGPGCTGSLSSFTAITISTPAPFGYYVVGYFPSYRNINDVPDVKFRMCNVVDYAFFAVNSGGTLTVPSNPSTTPAALITKARANGAKVMMSINDGAGDGKTNFRNMAATPAGRTAFIADVMAKVRQYGFDGVDMDWEFPTTSDGTDVTFTALMKQLSDSLHRDGRYYLTAAITAGRYMGGIRDAVKAELFGYVDFFNIMAYDDFSTSVPYKHHSDMALANYCLDYWLNTRGMPAQKCVLGVPAYGRPSGITQSGTILTYRDILSRGGSPLSDSAVVTNGAFTNYTIYYNGTPTTKRKAILAKQRANGVMFWEKGQDAHDVNSLLKAACDTVGRAY